MYSLPALEAESLESVSLANSRWTPSGGSQEEPVFASSSFGDRWCPWRVATSPYLCLGGHIAFSSSSVSNLLFLSYTETCDCI